MSSDAEGAALKSLAELGLTALRPFSKPLSGLFIDSRLVKEGACSSLCLARKATGLNLQRKRLSMEQLQF
jgi:hypothetical protein